MSNGIWSGAGNAEKLQQSELTRHRLLVVCAGSNIAIPWPNEAASGFANLDPNTIGPDTSNPSNTPNRGPEGGPHFVMSGTTPDESHTYGFEFILFDNLTAPASAAAGGFTVTVWLLLSNTQDPYDADTPVWASLSPNTGVNVREVWHSFDINAEAVRFQFGNLALDPTVNNLDIGIAFAEL